MKKEPVESGRKGKKASLHASISSVESSFLEESQDKPF